MEILLGKCCLEWHLLEHKLQLALLKAFKMNMQNSPNVIRRYKLIESPSGAVSLMTYSLH